MTEYSASQRSSRDSKYRQLPGTEGEAVVISFFVDESAGKILQEPFNNRTDARLRNNAHQKIPPESLLYLKQEDSEGFTTVDRSGGKGNIWLCYEEDISAIDRTVSDARKHQAAAVIVTKWPTQSQLPIILLSAESMAPLLGLKNEAISVKATIENHIDCRTSKNLEAAMHTNIEQNLSTSLRESENVDSFQIKKNKNQDASKTSSSWSAVLKLRSTLVNAVTSVANAVGLQTKQPTPFELILQERNNWNMEDFHDSFKKATDILNEAVSTKPFKERRDNLGQIVEALQSFLKREDYNVDMLLLEFSASVYRKCLCQTLKCELEASILKSLWNLSLSTSGATLKEVVLDALSKQNCEMYWFFFHLDYLKVGKIENEKLTKLIWMYFYQCKKRLDEQASKNFHMLAKDDFFDTQYCTLKAYMHEIDMHSMYAYFQPSLERLCSIFVRKSPLITIRGFVHKRFQQLINNEIKNEESPQIRHGNLLLIPTALENTSFLDDSIESRRKIIEQVVSHFNFPFYRTFEMMETIIDVVSIDHPDYALFQEIARKHVCNELGTWTTDLSDFVTRLRAVQSLFHLPALGSLLMRSKEGIEAIFGFSMQAVISHGVTLEVRFAFVGALYDALVIERKAVSPDTAATDVRKLLENLLCNENSLDVLIALIKIWCLNPRVFLHPEGASPLLEWLVKAAVSEATFRIFCDPNKMSDIVITKRQVESSTLLSLVATELTSELIHQCKCIESAIILFQSWYANGCNTNHVLAEVAEQLLVSYCKKRWRPLTINVLVEVKAQELLKILGCLATEERSEIRNSFLADIQTVITQWQQKFEADHITKNEVESYLKADSESWKILNGFFSPHVILPKKEDFEKKWASFVELGRSIRDSFVVTDRSGETSQTVIGILRRYNAVLEADDTLMRLLKKYSCEFMIESNINETTLHEMRCDLKLAQDCLQENNEILRISAFFMQKPSFLFRDALGCETWRALPPSHFFEKVRSAKNIIHEIFLETVNYKTVVDKSQLILTSGGDLQEQMLMLRSCPGFDIMKANTDRFCIVTMLSEVVDPLQRLLNCCRQLKFGFVDVDPLFSELGELVREISAFEAAMFSCGRCLLIARKLIRILFRSSSVDAALSDEYRSLQSCIGFLDVFGILSLNSDVWTLVGDMKWFGEDGLPSFYQAHENVTNMFLDGSASYETAVLNSVEACVRCLAPIVDLSSTSSFERFLSYLHTIDMSHIAPDDFKAVQNNVSSIRDWFTNGMDDIAATFVIFKKISVSGEYYIGDEAIGSEASRLCLRYQDHDSSTSKCIKIMRQEAINEFVERLGFIQHENESISKKVESFIEQHYAILYTVKKLHEMYLLGFPEENLSRFSFKVFNLTLQDAKALVVRSNKEWLSCEKWLGKIYSEYPLSLLFSLEELMENNAHLTSDAILVNEMALDRLAHAVKRLLWNGCGNQCVTDEVKKIIRSFSSPARFGITSWLVSISKFLQLVHTELCGPGIYAVVTGNAPTQSEIVVHLLSCDVALKRDALVHLLKHIYVNRLPKEFEVIDGKQINTRQKINILLARVAQFPGCTFFIFNADKIAGNFQEVILSFLSDPNIISKGIHLQLVQCRPTLIDASPYAQLRNWGNNSFNDISSYSVDDWFRSAVLNKDHVCSITVVATDGCGTGKTRFIRENLCRLEIESKAQIGMINIHEGTTLATLVATMSSKFPRPCPMNAAYFSLSFMGTDGCFDIDLIDHLNDFFMALLVLKYVHDPNSASSFHLSGKWDFFIELQEIPNDPNNCSQNPKDWLKQHIPILLHCGRVVEPSHTYDIDKEAHRVCTYLRALQDGTINRKFSSHSQKCVIFVLDESGSMQGHKLDIATDNALKIFDSHVLVDDMIELITFDSTTRVQVPLQRVRDEDHKDGLKAQLYNARYGRWGGTNMYDAINRALCDTTAISHDVETWIVCLTDGESSDTSSIIESRLRDSRDNIHVILIGVDLQPSLYEPMREICSKFRTPRNTQTKGFFIPTVSELRAMNHAFQSVANCIPVSQTFDFDGKLSDDDCRALIKLYLPKFVVKTDMLLQRFWIKFLYRRVKVFDGNKEFNYNKTQDSLGSSLMETMLSEVEQFLREDQVSCWSGKNHHQLIYDFADIASPEFRLVCTAPEKMDFKTREKYQNLNLPGFIIPTTENLEKRSTLDRFLSQALNVPLITGDDGQQRLPCIDDNGFVLTLDFTMKLLSIHERVACRVPCIVEGETGVSKTALTKMYSILVNSRFSSEAKAVTDRLLEDFEMELKKKGFSFESCDAKASSCTRLEQALALASESVHDITDLTDLFGLTKDECHGEEGGQDGDDRNTQMATELFALLKAACDDRSSIFQAPPSKYLSDADGSTNLVLEFLSWFSGASVEPTFFEINVHASLTEADVLHYFEAIRASAKKIKTSQASVVVFLDEVNTSSIFGLFKEIIIDHSICGDELEENIVIIAACNPARKKEVASGVSQRENDLGKEWASGHYQVFRLPASIEKLKWAYGSLSSNDERKFVKRRIEMLGHNIIPHELVESLSDLVSASQETIRFLAAEHIKQNLKRDATALDVELRAASTVSLRDIQRAFSFFDFFSNDFKIFCRKEENGGLNFRYAMLLAIAVVYYLRLDAKSRKTFVDRLENLPAESGKSERLKDVLDNAMDIIISNTEIPPGIALTRGLRENIFMTLVCSLSQTPLMIIGPPGSSKTLSVNIVSDNANGQESPNPFYRDYSRLTIFHYQCSKASTSMDIQSVFQKAIQRQQRVNSSMQKCIVFMDEAGLPEEKRESMKVLHYFLEGHMSAKADVGFVAITNHVLDAAKSNRCVTLHREEPDRDELLTIAGGVLFDAKIDGSHTIREIQCDDITLSPEFFSRSLCDSYIRLLHDKTKFKWFGLFFGLRDFIYFLRALSRRTMRNMTMEVSVKALLQAIERNFNGNDPRKLKDVIWHFVGPIVLYQAESMDLIRCSTVHSDIAIIAKKKISSMIRHPMDVVREAISKNVVSNELTSRVARFKLIIDETEDDSIIRLLSIKGNLDVSKQFLFKLSSMPEGCILEQSRLVSGIKYAAQQGITVILSQTEPVNESFYDLFNQNFRSLKNRDGQTCLYANIAVGGVSRRSLVQPTFLCIVHIKQSDIEAVPAPFLNRFEKFYITVRDVLDSGWGRVPGIAKVIHRARARLSDLSSLFGANGIFGWVELQTLDSIFVDMLPQICDEQITDSSFQTLNVNVSSFTDHVSAFIRHFTSLAVIKNESLSTIMTTATQYLSIDDAFVLESLLGCSPSIKDATMKEAFRSVAYGGLETSLSRVIRIVIELFLTKAAAFRLILLTTPEALYACRRSLPPEIIDEYFRQEHFSLKAFIAQLLSAQNTEVQPILRIVHTRTDYVVHSLPSVPVGQDATQDVSYRKDDMARNLVCDNLDILIIEHLLLLKSEAAIRSVVDSWASHSSKHLFLLVVDMSQHSANSVNFIRTLVEQKVLGVAKKIFVLLLHYPSSSYRKSPYPALFLGGWKHIFLDEVGRASQINGVQEWIRNACRITTGNIVPCKPDISSLMQRALRYAASQYLFYSGQTGDDETFSGCLNTIQQVMTKSIQGVKICDIMSEIIVRELTERSLLTTLQRASDGLLQGTTQLSMSSSLQSMFQEKTNILFTSCFCELNQWRNVDILFNTNCSATTDDLFCFILRSFSVSPPVELMLGRNMKSRLQPTPCNINPKCPSSVKFPFFLFVSSFLDQAVDMVMATMASKLTFASSQAQAVIFTKDMLTCVSNILQKEPGGLEQAKNLSPNQKLIAEVVEIVRNDSSSKVDSLFQRYLSQYVQWKVGCETNSMVIAWIMIKITEMGEMAYNNILSIHVVAKKYELELFRLASWTEYSKMPVLAMNSLSSTNVYMLGGIDLLRSFIQQFEKSLVDIPSVSYVWASSFSIFLCQIREIVGLDSIDHSVFVSLRVLAFIHILILVSAPSSVIESVILQYYCRGSFQLNQNTSKLPSLQEFMHIVAQHWEGKDNSIWVEQCTDLMLRRFFSSQWLDICDSPTQDFSFLIDFIIGEKDARRHQLTVTLLRNMCLSNCKYTTSTSKLEITSFSREILEMVFHRVDCENLQFDVTTGRAHFVPNWMVREEEEIEDQRENTPSDCIASFFSNFKPVKFCPLARAMFDLVLGNLLQQGQKANSEDLLDELLSDIDDEYNCIHRHRNAAIVETQSNSAINAVAAMITDARLFCFIAKVSCELGFENSGVATLSGTHREPGGRILQTLMSLKGYKWQEFFLSNIIRVGGMSTLLKLFGENGALHNFLWCQPLVVAMQKLTFGWELKKFQEAEESLRKALCGEVRGLDDVTFDGLRAQVQSLHEHLSQCEMISKASGMNVPVLLHLVEENANTISYVPTFTLSANSAFSDTPTGKAFVIAKDILFEERANVNKFSYLPDFIELYCWIHSTLKFLVTREEAATMKIKAIMKESILSRRFDTVSSIHIIRVWKRAIRGFEDITGKSDKYSVVFDGQDVEIPFQRLEEANLFMLLSQGNLPNAGEDYLFLLINDLITKSNSLSRRFNEIWGEITVQNLHPKFLLHGSVGAGVIGSLNGYSFHDMSSHLESIWCAERNMYDLERATCVFQEMKNALCKRPVILNPFEFLREPFQFRDVFIENLSCIKNIPVSFKSTTGDLFVHDQDLQLFEDVLHSLKKLQLGQSSTTTPRAFSVNFYRMDYDYLRSTLEALRTSMDTLPIDIKKKCVTFEEAVSSVVKIHLSNDSILDFFGFPRLTDAQTRCILSLELRHVYEFVLFLGHQIASEAYLFSDFPLCMTNPLPAKAKDTLISRFGRMCERGLHEAIRSLDEFTEDILGVYEGELRQASSSNESLRLFLEARKWCDESKYTFCKLIPEAITIHNYIPFRQQLHQMKLAMRSKYGDISIENKPKTKAGERSCLEDSSFARDKRGQTWLWISNFEDGNESDLIEGTQTVEVSSTLGTLGDDALWFEVGNAEADAATLKSPDIETEKGISIPPETKEDASMLLNNDNQFNELVVKESRYAEAGTVSLDILNADSVGEEDSFIFSDPKDAYADRRKPRLILLRRSILLGGLFCLFYYVFCCSLILQPNNKCSISKSSSIFFSGWVHNGSMTKCRLSAFIGIKRAESDADLNELKERDDASLVMEQSHSLDFRKPIDDGSSVEVGTDEDSVVDHRSAYDAPLQRDFYFGETFSSSDSVNLICGDQTADVLLSRKITKDLPSPSSQILDENPTVRIESVGTTKDSIEDAPTESQSKYCLEKVDVKKGVDISDVLKSYLDISKVEKQYADLAVAKTIWSKRTSSLRSALYLLFYWAIIFIGSALFGFLVLLFATAKPWKRLSNEGCFSGELTPSSCTEHQTCFPTQTSDDKDYGSVPCDFKNVDEIVRALSDKALINTNEDIAISGYEDASSLKASTAVTRLKDERCILGTSLSCDEFPCFEADEVKATSICEGMKSSFSDENQITEVDGSMAGGELDCVTIGSLSALGVSLCEDLHISSEDILLSNSPAVAEDSCGSEPALAAIAQVTVVASESSSSNSVFAEPSWVEVDVASEEDVDKYKLWQPLHYSVQGGHVYGIEYTIQSGADVNALTFENESPLDIAIRCHGESHPVVEKLRSLGGRSFSDIEKRIEE